MTISHIKQLLELRQISVYFGAVSSAAVVAWLVPGTSVLESGINPALAMMLFVTFLQLPLASLGRALTHVRFLSAAFSANFMAIPLFLVVLLPFLPSDAKLRFGVILVLLCPCVDYVVTFSHIGKANAPVLLAATPLLLIAQMILLPMYLRLFLGKSASALVQFEPFVQAFVWLIAIPFLLASIVQLWSSRTKTGAKVSAVLDLAPVPATALVLFIVVAAVFPQLGTAIRPALKVTPIYLSFAVAAPFIGWFVARIFKLDAPTSRSIAFCTATRNSLVVLPLALTVPGAVPVLPAVIVAQTLVELGSELLYVRWIPKLGEGAASASPPPAGIDFS